MESYEIFEDLAPFNGDLFMLDAPVEFEPFGFDSNSNGKNSLLKSSHTSHRDDDGSPAASPVDAAIGGPYDQPWLDTTVDIQQILQCQDAVPKVKQEFTVLHIPEKQEPQENSYTAPEVEIGTGFQVLQLPEQSIATEVQNNENFSFGTDSGINLSIESTISTSDVDLSGLVPFDDTFEDLELEHYMSSETILSPMSPEDIESILSVSPAPQEGSFENIQAFSDNSPATTESKIITIDLSQLHPSITSELQKCLLGSGLSSGDETSDNILEVQSTSSSPRYTPYETPKRKSGRAPRTTEKKTRKMKQNKEAALRYRVKKKSEQELMSEECEQLEERNKELHDSVDSLTREIQYLKGLMADVYKAKGHKLAVKGIKKSK